MVVPVSTLDPLTLPLNGARLIEASAGTGKTWTIAALYLRLLLGLGGDAAFPRPLSVESILVVTFTEAATEELRGRIRANIHDLRIACVRARSDNPLYQQLLKEIPDLKLAARLLLLAERQMDDAAIFTIHGFCQRMLSLNAFESGMPFEQQLVEDEAPLRQRACADFWRRYCYPLEKGVAKVISELWNGPDALLRDIERYLQGEAPSLKQVFPDEETLQQRHDAIIHAIDKLKARWRECVKDIAALIEQSAIDRRKFNRKNQDNWLGIVQAWAESPTENYAFPEALTRFSQSFLNSRTKPDGQPPMHALFSDIDVFLSQPLTLRDLVIARALSAVRYAVAEEKRRRGELGFDDMLSRLDSVLSKAEGEPLACAIRGRFPVAMIDEFQDTDPQQYRIFRRIWLHQPEAALLLIGDPKQAIYAFRGADIFTYMKARSEVSAHYTLETNWRSSPSMVASVNRLFSHKDCPFMFREIPFLPVQPAGKNRALRFTINGAIQPAMALWLLPGEGCGVVEYQQTMARQCARTIRDWLVAGASGDALLEDDNGARPVKASDITVLVRSRHEASLIREALSATGIPSVYLSNRDSVFSTLEAQDILRVLQAILNPEVESLMRSALATSLFGLDAVMLDSLSQDESAWDALVDEFVDYRQRWLQRGVMPMMRTLMTRRRLAENVLASEGGERRLTDILHISELLQETSVAMDSEHALVRWLAQSVARPDVNAASQQLRLESDRHLVQVVTIHKSKGLEYPLVCLPFIANYRAQAQALYHDRETFEAVLDLHNEKTSLELAEAERLAEDLRLLYVAVTRSVWHCSLGIAPLFRGNRAKKGESDFHLSAPGHLIQKAQPGDAVSLKACLDELCDETLQVLPVDMDAGLQPWQPSRELQDVLEARIMARSLNDEWRVTSYSGLQQQGNDSTRDLLPRLDVDGSGAGPQLSEPALSIHAFPRGASPGTFLHSLFEQIDFTQPVSREWVEAQLLSGGYDAAWGEVMTPWLETLLNAQLTPEGTRLRDISPADKRVEMAFYLPIDAALTAPHLDILIRQHDALSARCPPLNFRQVRGMLKGFIDLLFRWQGRYYLLDYKSNWLGEGPQAYTTSAMAQAMCEHRYDLQYQLYTLAVHRYLRHRIPDYDYQRHFGGVIYLFLRGVCADNGSAGIFSTRPDIALIEQMDALFAGKDVPQ